MGLLVTIRRPAEILKHIVYRSGTSISIVLLENLEKRGVVGDVIEVKRGFARNFLIPRKKAGTSPNRFFLSWFNYFSCSLCNKDQYITTRISERCQRKFS